jgi:hypothetical protein
MLILLSKAIIVYSRSIAIIAGIRPFRNRNAVVAAPRASSHAVRVAATVRLATNDGAMYNPQVTGTYHTASPCKVI